MKMPKKVIQVGNTRYWINSVDDAVSMIRDLLKQGYSISQISNLTGINERWIRRYLNNY